LRAGYLRLQTQTFGICAILIAFPLQQWLHKHAYMLRILPTLLISRFDSFFLVIFFRMETFLDHVSTFHNEHIATFLPMEQHTVNMKQGDKTEVTISLS
jgi:hypothetical protein